jgi:hypothetical protein
MHAPPLPATGPILQPDKSIPFSSNTEWWLHMDHKKWCAYLVCHFLCALRSLLIMMMQRYVCCFVIIACLDPKTHWNKHDNAKKSLINRKVRGSLIRSCTQLTLLEQLDAMYADTLIPRCVGSWATRCAAQQYLHSLAAQGKTIGEAALEEAVNLKSAAVRAELNSAGIACSAVHVVAVSIHLYVSYELVCIKWSSGSNDQVHPCHTELLMISIESPNALY